MANDARLAELRGLLAEALQGNPVNVIQRGPRVFVDATGPMTAKTAYSLADALAPVVSAWAEREAARRAAEELLDAAGAIYVDDRSEDRVRIVTFLRARAATLTPANEEQL